MAKSKLEEAFHALWKQHGSGREPIREYRFFSSRRWKFDFAWTGSLVAVEIEGGVFTGGRHNRGAGFVKDCEKYNTAALNGWRVLRYTAVDLRDRPLQVVEEVIQALEG